jgi:predicted RNA-binding Zn ribbon-like protein
VDFLNTWEYFRGVVTERLQRPDQVADWLGSVGVLSPEARSALRQRFALDAASGRRWLNALRRLRTTLRGAADALIAGASLDDEQIEELNRRLRLRTPAPRLERDATKRRYRLARAELELNGVQARLVWSFLSVLVAGPLERLRRCSNPECSFVFLDVSPTGRRRWCSMRTCGNQAKVAAYQARRGRRSEEREDRPRSARGRRPVGSG